MKSQMIALAANEVVEALTDVQNGTFSAMACPVTINEGESRPHYGSVPC